MQHEIQELGWLTYRLICRLQLGLIGLGVLVYAPLVLVMAL